MESRPQPASQADGEGRLERLVTVAIMLVPGVLTVYLAFNSGGFFADETGIAAAAVAVLLALRVTTAGAPLGGLRSPWLLASVVALALYALWTMISTAWSDAAGRALVEYDRVVLYVLVLALLGSVPWSSSNARWLVRGLAAAAVVVCVAGLITRLLPDFWPTDPNIVPDRLSYPLSYWNALGLLAAAGILLCVHLASTAGDRLPIRALAAAAVPPLAVTLLLTFSRGAIAAGVVGLAAYLVLGRPRHLLQGLLATVPAAAVAVVATYQADDVVDRVGSAAAVSQGKELAVVVGACAGGAALVRLVLGLADRWQARRPPLSVGRPVRLGIVAAGVAGLLVVAVALDAPDAVSKQYKRFVNGDNVKKVDPRDRLTEVGNNDRLEHWRVARDEFERHPWRGRGAGTYALTWLAGRPSQTDVQDAHSLYMEVLSELGLVGLLLLGVALLGGVIGLAVRIRGPDRAVHAVFFAVAVTLLVRAGLDWDWEMPAVMLWLVAVLGVGLAAQRSALSLRQPLSRYARIGVALGLLVVAVAPAAVAVSQRRLNSAVAALVRNDCTKAIDSALGSISAIDTRPEPFEVLGYCDARIGRTRFAEQAFRAGIRRDPDNWEPYYGLALAQALRGSNPAKAARTARRLNPRGALTRDAAAALIGTNPRTWRRFARRTPLALPPSP